MDTKKLRQKILDLAIRGKLVPQDPNDEPACVLLERIRAEKERLIAEGKIKRPKKSKTTSSESHYQKFEPPFEIPDSWEWVKLGEIGLWQSGATPSKSNPNYFGKGYPWLNTGDLNDGYISLIPKEITPLALKETSVKLNPAGSVLIAMYGATIGKLGILNIDATTNQACCACYKYWINQKYLFFFLLAWRPQFIQMGGGGAQPNISKEKIEETYIPCPPANEQLRIERQIEFIFELLNKLDVSKNDIEKTVVKTKSKILELAMQGKLVPQDPTNEPAAEMLKRINPNAKIITDNPHYPQLPDNWVTTSLGCICDFERGITFPTESKEFEPSPVNIACLRTTNIQEEVDLSSLWFIDKLYLKNNPAKLLRVGDIIMSTANSKELVGRSVIVKNLPYDMTFGGFVTVVRTKILDPYFLLLFLKYRFMRRDLSEMASQTTNIANLSTIILSSVDISFPGIEEQERIVKKIHEIFSTLENIVALLL